MTNEGAADAKNYKDIIDGLLSLPPAGVPRAGECCPESAAEGLRMSEEIGYEFGRAHALLILGEHASKGELEGAVPSDAEDALSYFAKAKETFALGGCDEGAATAALFAGRYFHKKKLYNEAEAAYREAAAIAEKAAAAFGEDVFIDAMCGLGAICVDTSRPDDASAYLKGALERLESGNAAKRAEVYYELGRLEISRSDAEKAKMAFAQSADGAIEEGKHRIASMSARGLSRIYFNAGLYREYEEYAEKAAEYEREAALIEKDSEMASLRALYQYKSERVASDPERQIKKNVFVRNALLEEANWQLNTIQNIGQKITSLQNTREVLRTIYYEICAHMDADGFYIAAYNEDNGMLEYKILYENGVEAEPKLNMRQFIPKTDFAYQCVNRDEIIVINDLSAEKGVFASGAHVAGSVVYTSLKIQGRLFGVMCVSSKYARSYSPQQARLLDSVSSYVSIALDNAIAYQKLDDMSKTVASLANHDSLTGIPNRRLLMELVPRAYANAMRTNSKVAFLFLDLDRFKPINDKYGHQAGDAVLKIFTERVLGLIRSSDIFARVGGDEFIVVMTDLKLSENAGTLAKKIINETQMPFSIRNTENRIGVSIGISIYPDDSRDTDLLIVMADEAMYRIKNGEKNNYAYFNEIHAGQGGVQ